ncbi:hypothetical protein AKO1_015832 [Acrasis kona]|uniref:Uncharacterized protein n=1 Tax=Acrasis kona TaxID=1008807 RepID=A0AAW2ZIY3_9EUKA
MTNGVTDQQDLYVLSPSSSQSHYVYNNQSVAYEIRKESINIKGQSTPKEITIRSSRWGPVINQVFTELTNLPPVSLRWTGLLDNDTSMETFNCHWRATSWSGFTDCFKYLSGPSMNNLYADKNKNIGYFIGGKIPLRRKGHSGLVAVNGDDDRADYMGYSPREGLYKVLNPDDMDYIVTANNKAAPDGVRHSTGIDYAVHFRSTRVNQLLQQQIKSGKKFDVSDVKSIQLDVHSVYFDLLNQHVIPKMKLYVAADQELNDHVQSLQEWNGDMTMDSKQATLFEFWIRELSSLAGNEIGADYIYANNHMYFTLDIMIKNSTDVVCKNLGVNSCIEAAVKCLQRAVSKIKSVHGDIPQWGKVHTIVLPHSILDNTALKCMASDSIASGGGTETVNVADVSGVDEGSATMTSNKAPNFRFLMDMSEDYKDSFMFDLGQDGNMLSAEYSENLQKWRDGDYFDVNQDESGITSWRYSMTFVPK